MIKLWTDGSAFPNPGPGGYAVIDEDGKPVALGREEKSSNIRMEGSALIAAMELFEGEEIRIMTDSEFWINVLTNWAPTWEENGWSKRNRWRIQDPEEREKPETNKKYIIKNLDLVQRAYELYDEGCVELKWIRGHDGNKRNELADRWARRARKGATL